MLYRDSIPTPDQIPGDAIVALAFDANSYPQRWWVVGLLTDVGTLDDALAEVGHDCPELDGRDVLVTKVGGNSGLAQRVSRSVSERVKVTTTDPPPPPELAETPTG
jgi:hypothetical protein